MAGFGASFGPVMLFALFWKRSNLKGALAGMVSGGLMVFIWKYGVRPLGGAWNIYELLPAFIVASAAIVLVSLATEEPSEAICRQFDSVGDPAGIPAIPAPAAASSAQASAKSVAPSAASAPSAQ